MHRFTGRQANLNQSVLAGARNGSTIRLLQLRDAIVQDPKQVTMEVLDIMFGIIDPGLIRSTDITLVASTQWKEQSNRALLALAGIATITNKCTVENGVSASVVDAIVDRLVVGFYDIIYWMGYLLHFAYTLQRDGSGGVYPAAAYFSHARSLLSILSYHPRLLDCLMSSPSAIDLVLQFWMGKSETGEPFAEFTITQEPTSCWIIRLLLYCVSTTGGLTAIVDRLFARSVHTFAVFVTMTTVRCQMVYWRLTDEPDDPYRKYAPAGACICYFQELCELVYRLVPDKRIWASFLKVSFVTKMTTTALTLGKHANNPREFLLIGAQVFPSFISHSHGMLWNMEQMFSLGFFNYFMTQVASSKFELERPNADNSTVVKMTDLLLQLLDISTMWPAILKRMDAHRKETPTYMWSLVENLPLVGRQFKRFIESIDERLKVDASLQECIILCDNPYCCSEAVLLRNGGKSRKCSSCRAFVYCSEACQQEDWNNFHRDECRHARLDHRDKKRYYEVYTHRMRAFHVALIEMRFNLFIARHIDRTHPDKRPADEMETATFSPDADLTTSQTKLYTFDASQAYSRILCVPPGSYEWLTLPVSDQPYLQRRFEEGFLRHTGESVSRHSSGRPAPTGIDGMESETVHYVEGTWTMGDKEVMVMVKLRVHTEVASHRSKFRVASSMVRMGYVIVCLHISRYYDPDVDLHQTTQAQYLASGLQLELQGTSFP